jgi:hypothetical protein
MSYTERNSQNKVVTLKMQSFLPRKPFICDNPEKKSLNKMFHAFVLIRFHSARVEMKHFLNEYT